MAHMRTGCVAPGSGPALIERLAKHDTHGTSTVLQTALQSMPGAVIVQLSWCEPEVALTLTEPVLGG
jgi:hypothetical protein